MGTKQVWQKSFEFCKMKDVGIVNQIVCTLVQLLKKDRQAANPTLKITKNACNRVLQIVEILITKQKSNNTKFHTIFYN